ncbi:MAG: nucleotide pyrophosphohydrolase [Thermoprotei archaeon]|nr:MAG: nucleotide pyrophosphohydrolase [Thermoprotei archaeon]RLF15752.1 MAG: nucleotide pyrophosphohydrolase [Thermoprotei archaeon]
MHIGEFQDMIRRLYWHKDSKRGVEKNFIHLVEEIGELGRAIVDGNREAIESELADSLAWLVTMANVLDVNIEEAALSKYNNVCPKCGSSPCSCP